MYTWPIDDQACGGTDGRPLLTGHPVVASVAASTQWRDALPADLVLVVAIHPCMDETASISVFVPPLVTLNFSGL